MCERWAHWCSIIYFTVLKSQSTLAYNNTVHLCRLSCECPTETSNDKDTENSRTRIIRPLNPSGGFKELKTGKFYLNNNILFLFIIIHFSNRWVMLISGKIGICFTVLLEQKVMQLYETQTTKSKLLLKLY